MKNVLLHRHRCVITSHFSYFFDTTMYLYGYTRKADDCFTVWVKSTIIETK